MNVPYQAMLQRNRIKEIGHHAHKRDMMANRIPFIPNHVHYLLVHVTFCGSWKKSILKENLKNLVHVGTCRILKHREQDNI